MYLPTIEVNSETCVHCGACLNECFAGLLEFSNEQTPRFIDGGAARCFRCQHCMAICPAGALSWSGKAPSASKIIGPTPPPNQMANLIRQRRSIRKYLRKNVAPAILDELKSLLAFVPTGCNDHRLFLSISDDLAVTDSIRQSAIESVLKSINESSLPANIAHFARLKPALEKGIDIFFRNAPHFAAISVPPESKDAHIDPYIAATQLEMAANSFGLGTCWGGMATNLFKSDRTLYERLNIPATHVLKIILLFGYPDVQYFRLPQPEPIQSVSVS